MIVFLVVWPSQVGFVTTSRRTFNSLLKAFKERQSLEREELEGAVRTALNSTVVRPPPLSTWRKLSPELGSIDLFSLLIVKNLHRAFCLDPLTCHWSTCLASRPMTLM